MADSKGTHRVSLRKLQCPAPAEAMLLVCSGFPIPEPERAIALRAVTLLSRAWIARSKALSHVFLHISSSKNPAAAPMISPHARKWAPELGFGVWPARQPPALWTKEEFEALQPGEPPRALAELVFRITCDDAAKEHARGVMFGTGAVIEVQTPDDGPAFTRRATQLLLPTIQDESFRSYPYYFPLLDGATVAAANYAALQSWLCGGGAYIRESIEDCGVLVVALESLRPVLDQIGAVPDPQAAGGFVIPVD
jgi:hypothetical protein